MPIEGCVTSWFELQVNAWSHIPLISMEPQQLVLELTDCHCENAISLW